MYTNDYSHGLDLSSGLYVPQRNTNVNVYNNIDTEVLKHGKRTVFVSDQHLFHPLNGRAEYQASIVEHEVLHEDADTIVVVGDFVDYERVVQDLKEGMELVGDSRELSGLTFAEVEAYIGFKKMEAHKRYIDMLIAFADSGKRVILINGNHDINLQVLDGLTIENIDIRENVIFEVNGKRLFVEHGHESDPECIKNNPGLYNWGSRWLDRGMQVDHGLNKILLNPISDLTRINALRDSFVLTNFLKFAGKGYIGIFRENAVNRAEARGLDGNVCGHIHRSQIGVLNKKLHMEFDNAIGAAEQIVTPRIAVIEDSGMLYLNTGDGFNHGTALIQTGDADFGHEGWTHKSRSDVPLSKSFMVDQPNPYAEYRGKTDKFLEAGWLALVAYVRNPAIICSNGPDRPEPTLRGRVPVWPGIPQKPREQAPDLVAA